MADDSNNSTKIFVGNIPPSCSESDIKNEALQFGTIKQYIYKFVESQNRAWALITYDSKDQSIRAINALDSKTITGPDGTSSSQLEARFAHSKQKPHNMNNYAVNNVPGYLQNYNLYNRGMNPNNSSVMPFFSSFYGGNNPAGGIPGPMQAPPPPLKSNPVWQEYFTMEGHPYYYNVNTRSSQWERPIDFEIDHQNPMYHQNQFMQNITSPSSMMGNKSMIPNNTYGTSTANYGPSGCNLFIFHIPNNWSDFDLISAFSRYGRILSARVQKDDTGRNRGFGFVSYDNNQSAQRAIEDMNGYCVDNKYLKVQIKRDKN